jgi:hypothetical protein
MGNFRCFIVFARNAKSLRTLPPQEAKMSFAEDIYSSPTPTKSPNWSAGTKESVDYKAGAQP